MLEDFVQKFGKHDAAGWVLEQLQAGYLKANQSQKTIDAGEKLLALDPEHVFAAQQNLKAAEALKDAALVRKWSGLTSDAARKVVASPQPKEEGEVDAWKRDVDYARQVDTYTEYALYAQALQQPDPKIKIEMFETLEQRNPKSEYLARGMQQRFLAYRQAGDNARALAFAESVLATSQDSEDMLLLVADNYLNSKKDPAKVQAYAGRVVELMNAKPKPEGVTDADWNARKNQILALAHFLSGKQHYIQNNFGPADKSLRAALPLIANDQLKAEALFYLGVSNFKMEKVQDAAEFNRQCAAIKSPFQATANKNLAAIKAQYRGVK
jgi:TolA-binding protein